MKIIIVLAQTNVWTHTYAPPSYNPQILTQSRIVFPGNISHHLGTKYNKPLHLINEAVYNQALIQAPARGEWERSAGSPKSTWTIFLQCVWTSLWNTIRADTLTGSSCSHSLYPASDRLSQGPLMGMLPGAPVFITPISGISSHSSP